MKLFSNTPQSSHDIAERYSISIDAVQGILRHVGTVSLVILVVETSISRGLPLEDALYLVEAEWVL